ncbi:DUF3795 domain-containing protein [Longibaculum muris]|uniref:DUF3795 domain-containing protein n=1 Tax=Longibaculum muris TaxID=1796628 RepID=UPI0022E39BE4|nr:DUF3795 domain-containing protein [Longibaculum muris]
MIESRCGIKCSECEYKESMGCQGCLNIVKPFWGEACPIKDSCESQGYQHCGECDNFPCETLKAFAYDEKQGDNGLRIQQCEIWRNE